MELVGRLWQIQGTYLDIIYYNKWETKAKSRRRERKGEMGK